MIQVLRPGPGCRGHTTGHAGRYSSCHCDSDSVRARPHRTGRGSASESVAVDDRRGGRVGIDRVASDSPSRDNRYRAGSHGAGAGSAGSAVPAPDQPGPPPRRRRELAGRCARTWRPAGVGACALRRRLWFDGDIVAHRFGASANAAHCWRPGSR